MASLLEKRAREDDESSSDALGGGRDGGGAAAAAAQPSAPIAAATAAASIPPGASVGPDDGGGLSTGCDRNGADASAWPAGRPGRGGSPDTQHAEAVAAYSLGDYDDDDDDDNDDGLGLDDNDDDDEFGSRPARSAAAGALAHPLDDEGEDEGDELGGADDEDDGTSAHDSDVWIRRQKANNVSPDEILKQLGISVSHAASVDELWRLVAALVSQLRTRLLPRARLGAGAQTLEDACALLSRAQSIVVVTGAGISVSAGIPDFRSANGVYALVESRFQLPDPQSLFDIHYFAHDPEPFFSFAKHLYPGAYRPTASHRFIKALEGRGRLLRNYTQNIDTLERVAGIRRKHNCHGSFETASCLACKRTVPCEAIQSEIFAGAVPRCAECAHTLGILKPDIVFFGESLGEGFERAIQRDLPRCDLLVVIGSSMRVQPVASIPSMVASDVPQILINRELVLAPHQFDIELLGDCDVILCEIARRLGWGSLPDDDPDAHSAAALALPRSPCHADDDVGAARAPGAVPADPAAPAAYEFVPPNRYLFTGAVLPAPPLQPLPTDDAPVGEGGGDEAHAPAHDVDVDALVELAVQREGAKADAAAAQRTPRSNSDSA